MIEIGTFFRFGRLGTGITEVAASEDSNSPVARASFINSWSICKRAESMASGNTGRGNRAMQCVSFLSEKNTQPNKTNRESLPRLGFHSGKQSAVFKGVEITLMVYLFGMSLIACVLGSGPLTLRSKTHKVKFRAIDCFFTAQVQKKRKLFMNA